MLTDDDAIVRTGFGALIHEEPDPLIAAKCASARIPAMMVQAIRTD